MEVVDIIDLLIIAAKSVAVYIFILFGFRLFGKKELAQLSVFDLVFILLISNSVQNAMVGNNSTLIGGLAAALGLFIVNYLFKFLDYHFPQFNKMVQGEAVMLIYEGKTIKKNLVAVQLTIDELDAAVREHGVLSISEVNLAILEVDGSVSIISNEFKTKTVKKRKARKVINKQT